MSHIMIYYRKMYCATLILEMICLLVAAFIRPQPAAASEAGDLFKEAQSCHKRIVNASIKQRFRQFWFPCLKIYNKLCTQYPESPWAAAGLYESGKLYLAFYHQFNQEAYRQNALSNFKKVVTAYPSSPYKAKAVKAIGAVEAEIASKSANSDEGIAEFDLEEDEREVMAMVKSQGGGVATPSEGNESVSQVQAAPKVEKRDKDSQVKTQSDFDELKDRLASVEESPPDDSFDDTLSTDSRAGINQLDVSSELNHTRIVIHGEVDSKYSHHILKKDPTLNKPERFYVDIQNSRLGAGIRREVSINDDVLISARTGQFSHDVVRVVVELKEYKNYSVFSLQEPFRIVVDFWGVNYGN